MGLSLALQEFAERLAFGVRSNIARIDETLGPLIPKYSLDRLAAIDRSLLRAAAFEILFMPEVPPAVTISEAVVLAKKYSTADSSRFVNGVLAALLAGSDKANWDPATAPPEFDEEEPEPEEPSAEGDGTQNELAEGQTSESIEVREGTDEEKEFKRVGAWTIRVNDQDERPNS